MGGSTFGMDGSVSHNSFSLGGDTPGTNHHHEKQSNNVIASDRNVTHPTNHDVSFSDEMSDDGLDMLGTDSSVIHPSSRRTSHKNASSSSSEDKPMLGSKTISNTFRWKLFVVTLMLINTTFVITATSIFLKHQANQEFERSFDSAAHVVIDAAHSQAKATTDSLAVLGDVITSYTLDADAHWPFVTVPRFEERVSPIRASSKLDVIGYLPLVRTMEREVWEEYALQQQGWIQESYQVATTTTTTTTALLEGTNNDNDNNNSNSKENLLPLQEPPENNQSSTTFTVHPEYDEDEPYSISPMISVVTAEGERVAHSGIGPYTPIWMLSPPPPSKQTNVINTDLLSNQHFRLLFESFLLNETLDNNATGYSDFAISHAMPQSLYALPTTTATATTNPSSSEITTASNNEKEEEEESTYSVLFHPIRDSYHHQGEIKAFAMGLFPWQEFFSDVLPDNVNGLDVVLYNNCMNDNDLSAKHTFRIQGRIATYLGKGDKHEMEHSERHTTLLTEFHSRMLVDSNKMNIVATSTTSLCHFELKIFPSKEYQSSLQSKGPAIFTAVIAAVFLATGLIFLVYVNLVGNRQNKVMAIAMSTSTIVANLFPSNVRDQILKNAEEEVQLRLSDKKEKVPKLLRRNSIQQSTSHQQRESTMVMRKSKPIADLFPECTVLFADIVGFTAWSSVREPTQVFELLETIYHSFDEIARRRRVFKVETIGDCYVAVCGLPEPCSEHAVVMARFSRDCLLAMEILSKKLEVSLGPDTGELSMRFGLHSGPVTAGVLRGERSRFQLFGDTVNTASRLESNGKREMIQISEQTAKCLKDAGKEDWYVPREDKIVAKGKGEMQTYWLHTKKSQAPMSDISSQEDSFAVEDFLELPSELFDSNKSKLALGTNAIRQCLSEQNQRLATWLAEQLLQLLGRVVAQRNATTAVHGICPESVVENGTGKNDTILGSAHVGAVDSANVVDEVQHTLLMPDYDGRVYVTVDQTPQELSEIVQQQLHDYVAIICSMYIDHPFHNYQHASHVFMNVAKLFSSIAPPVQSNFRGDDHPTQPRRDEQEGADLHAKTFGISSDPMIPFALAFAAMMHDVDHPGRTNKQLVKEKHRLARIYENKSIAEQNSFQCAWDLLMDPSFDHLRAAIYTTKEEYNRFRDLVVCAVMATDLRDKDNFEARNKRWEEAFDGQEQAPESSIASQRELRDRQATLVLEYLIQASDIAHSMQHWHVYRKWNERLFQEMLKAHRAGRLEENPTEIWYQQEINFFENTVMPMARKLKACGAFGIYFDEYVNYATQNAQEWQRNGEQIVTEMEKTYDLLVDHMGDFSIGRDYLIEDVSDRNGFSGHDISERQGSSSY